MNPEGPGPHQPLHDWNSPTQEDPDKGAAEYQLKASAKERDEGDANSGQCGCIGRDQVQYVSFGVYSLVSGIFGSLRRGK